MSSPILEFIAREHPAFVHVPLGLVACLPLALLGSYRSPHPHAWKLTALFMAVLAWLSSSVALFSGLIWGRQISLIQPGAYLPVVASAKQVLQNMLKLHEFAALTGVVIGLACIIMLWQSLKRDPGPAGLADAAPHRRETDADPERGQESHHRRTGGRRRADQAVGAAAMVLSLAWLGAWGFCGKLGGIMVFGNEETNKAAAEADAKRKNDVEAELPIRALDYASLEPVEPAPVRSPAHGNRWRRVWVTASGFDAYKEGKPLPVGAYAVLTTFEDEKGKPGHEQGPIYMKETKADGSTAFAFYWPRVPEKLRSQVGGEESVYWRSPDAKLGVCLGCHEKGGSGAAAPAAEATKAAVKAP
jgi:hypothetical protein